MNQNSGAPGSLGLQLTQPAAETGQAVQNIGSSARRYTSLDRGLVAAESALVRGQRDTPLEILGELRQTFPAEPEPLFRAARILSDSGDSDGADLLLAEGQRRFPRHFGLWIQRAWLAHGRRDVASALDRWSEMRKAFPDHPVGYSGAGKTLREYGRIAEAEELIAPALLRFPDDPGIAAEHARIAEAGKSWTDAIARWEQMIKRFPERVEAYLGLGFAQRQQGHISDAEASLSRAMELFPDQARVFIDYAWVAHSMRSWAEAARHWQVVRSRFPDQEVGYRMGAEALKALAQFADADALLAEADQRFSKARRSATELMRDIRIAGQPDQPGILAQLSTELYDGEGPLTYAEAADADEGYPHTNLRPDLIESVLDVIRPKFWLELGSMLGGSAILTADVVKKLSLPTEIVCIDPFTGDVNMWAWEHRLRQEGKWRFLRLERGRPTIYDRFLANVLLAGHHDIILPIAATSIVGIKLLYRLTQERRLSQLPEVIYLDSAHEPDETFLELKNCWQLLQPGGVLMGDDWGWDAVRNDVSRFAATLSFDPGSARQLIKRHTKFSLSEGVLIDGGQWVLVKPK